jgi:16S rRNA (guanine527-N7)-methyltransferase
MTDEPISPDMVARGLAAAGVEASDALAASLARYLTLLRQWNRVYNLTGVRDPQELVDRHLVESLALRSLLKGQRIADIGTGAGLPGIPLAAAEPERSFTLVESRAKRVHFLRHVVGSLGLSNTQVEHCRVEDLPTAAAFDTVLARAVAPPAQLIQITRPLTAPGSILLMLTAAHLRGALAAAASDFQEREVDTATAKPLRSAIVMLERV